jgi:hypothetical protein
MKVTINHSPIVDLGDFGKHLHPSNLFDFLQNSQGGNEFIIISSAVVMVAAANYLFVPKHWVKRKVVVHILSNLLLGIITLWVVFDDLRGAAGVVRTW